MAKRDHRRVRASFLNRRGIKLALKMLDELEEIDHEGITLSDACQLESEFSQGFAFRNIVHERLQAARKLGPEVEEGFCLVLTQVVAMNALGFGGPADSVRALVRMEVANG